MTAKERITRVVREQPDDASYEEISRELAFARVLERGLADAEAGRVITTDAMRRRIRAWGAQGAGG